MKRGIRLLLIVACVALASLLAAGTASANRLSVNSTPFGIGFTPTFSNGLGLVSCESFVMTGTFHSRTFAKTAGLLLGFITEAAIREFARCSGGGARTLNETLPWHFRYNSFSGALPNITAINFRIVGATIGVTVGVTTCLYRSTEANPFPIIANREAGGRISSVRADESVTIPSISGGACALTNLRIGGTGAGTPSPVSFFLI